MRKILFLVLFIFSFYFFKASIQAQTDSYSGEHIKNFDSQITINKDGTIDVKESIIYDFGSLERHGIYRDIPFITTNKEGKK